MRSSIAFLCLFFVSEFVFAQEKNIYILELHPPLEIPLVLSANYGELRTDRFHSGVDFKTQGVVGHKVFAVEKGYVSRIRITTAGYGKSIYIAHPQGITTVYGHLLDFNPLISQFVKKYQYDNEVHTFDITPDPSMFPVQKGELIGLSGNSGYSFGPHLHFEIRNSHNQVPMNVLKFNFNIQDVTAPRFYTLAVYPLGYRSCVNGKQEKLLISLNGNGNKYFVPAGTQIQCYGQIGFGLEAYDFLDAANNRCGLYRLDVWIDNHKIYASEMDNIAFDETRYVNSFMDYAESMVAKKKIQKTFIDPNNRLSVYTAHKNRGVLVIDESREYKVKMVGSDVAGNVAELIFSVQGVTELPPTDSSVKPLVFSKFMPYLQENVFRTDDIQIYLSPLCLYDDIRFEYKQSDTIPVGLYSPIHVVHSERVPVHTFYDIAIRAFGIQKEWWAKALIVFVANDGKLTSLGGDFTDGFVSSRVRTFGSFAVAIDTTAPVITPKNFKPGANLSNKKNIDLIIKDDLSGINTYNGYIDNVWALFEYDPKNDLLTYTFDDKRLNKGATHILELYIVDNKNNLAYAMYDFFY